MVRGIRGDNYLNGTNADVGGYQVEGTATVLENLANGDRVVQVDARHTWNDVIDANDQYTTDKVKNAVAELIALGQADRYDISISREAQTTYVVAADGSIKSSKGWP